ncbi:MAG: DUF3006 domain-containing protein [Tissierellaceae bacterium]|nr:DUF3006 domain-containing protein [Tissierellaceae bacterium]
MKFTIDRFEGEYAVVELDTGHTVDITKAVLPPGAKEGDIISLKIEEEETEERRKRIQRKFENLFTKD